MLLSQLLGERYREKPADANIPSHVFMIKGGYMRPVSNGSFTLLPPAKRVINKIETIIREEMDAIGGQEVLFPVVLPREIWDQSGRYDAIGNELVRFKDRTGADLVLGMTHEEAAVHLAKSDARSYTKYPFMIYQIQTKFRDEPRARGGLIRVREFTMKDAYSFHTSQEDLERYYEICHAAYERIYQRTGLSEVISVRSDSGMMGGAIADEFMLLCDAGEDTIITCSHCDYRANLEVAHGSINRVKREPVSVQKVHTPGVSTIEELTKFLDKPADQMIKAAVFALEDSEQIALVFIRADLEVNEAKLRTLLGNNIVPLTDDLTSGLVLGFCGPYALAVPENVTVCYDASLENCHDMIGGANEKDYHYTGLSVGRDFHPASFVDLAKTREGDLCDQCGAPLTLHRGVEVGNIFQLGMKYTKSMEMTYIDSDGTAKHPIMGCYGIGVGRLAACIIEAHHDENGPIWPFAVAPWQVHICTLSNKKRDVMPEAKMIYDRLRAQYEVLWDDRGAAAGVQFADADLLGAPIRIIVSVRNVENNEVEIVSRDKSIQQKVSIDQIEEAVAQIAQKMM